MTLLDGKKRAWGYLVSTRRVEPIEEHNTIDLGHYVIDLTDL